MVMRCCCGYKILPGRGDFQGRENLTMPSNSCGLFGATGTQLLSSALRRNNCVHGGLRDGRIGQKNEEVAHSQSLRTATDLPALLAQCRHTRNSAGPFGATGTEPLSIALRRNSCVHGGLRDSPIGPQEACRK